MIFQVNRSGCDGGKQKCIVIVLPFIRAIPVSFKLRVRCDQRFKRFLFSRRLVITQDKLYLLKRHFCGL